jgi:hypothetical protein
LIVDLSTIYAIGEFLNASQDRYRGTGFANVSLIMIDREPFWSQPQASKPR